MPMKVGDSDNLLFEIRTVRRMLDQCIVRFNHESDSDLVEACIYEMEALRARYRYLLKTARLKGFSCSDDKLSGRFPASDTKKKINRW